MKKIVFTLLASLLFFYSHSQLAPNFTIVTTKGETLKLYENLLNKKKTVVVKLFFVQCPFCQQMSPLAQQLYEKWGSGTKDVEFISLSVLTSNTNTMVANYKTQYGEKFPGAGNDGGSVSAVQPYTSGQFGAYYGTPTFFVISPDKTVEWDPRGSSNQATIDSVDAAIARSRAKVGGSFSGRLMNACCNLKPIFPIGFYRQNQTTPDTIITTDSVGYYSLATFPSIWGDSSLIRVQAMIDSSLFYIPTKGVSTADLVRMNKHILGILPFDCPYNIYPADVNNDNKVSTADMVELRKMILYIQTNFSNNNSVNFYNRNLKDSVISKNSNFNLGKNYKDDYTYDLIVSKTGDPTCTSFLMDDIGVDRNHTKLTIVNQKIEAGFRQIPLIATFGEPMEGILVAFLTKYPDLTFVPSPHSYHKLDMNELTISYVSDRAEQNILLGYLEGNFKSGWLSDVLTQRPFGEVVAPSQEYTANVQFSQSEALAFNVINKRLILTNLTQDIVIYDIAGKIVLTKNGINSSEIDLSSLHQGIYIAKDNCGNYLKIIIP